MATVKKIKKVKKAQAGTSLDSAAARKYNVEPFDASSESATKKYYEVEGKPYPGNESMYKTISERRAKTRENEKTRLGNIGKSGYDKYGFPTQESVVRKAFAPKKKSGGKVVKAKSGAKLKAKKK